MSFLTGLLSTFGSWLIRLLVTDLISFVQSWFANRAKKKAEEVQQGKDAAKYEEVINKPDVSRDEQRQAEDDLLNRRH